MSSVRVADVALDPRTGGADAIYTYLAADWISKGEAVFVPLGNRSVLGFVTSVYEATEADLGFSLDRLKPVLGPVEGLSLPEALVDLAYYVSSEYLCSLPVALSPAVPPGVRDRLLNVWTVAEGARDQPLTPLQKEVLRTLEDQDGEWIEQKSKPIPASSLRALRLLRNKGFVRQSQRIAPFAERKRGEDILRLTSDAAKLESFLQNEGKQRPAQALTLMRLQGAEVAQFTAAEIRVLAQVTDATIKALVSAGMLEAHSEWRGTVTTTPKPNPYQQIAIDAVSESIRNRIAASFLLFGVTGSGKTEVYLRAASEALRQGRQVLYLVPEIALAAQAIGLLRERFGANVTILHSELPARERLENWLKIRSGKAGVVLGARSALFAPISNLGLIILDEEHEASYKQETAPRYHARHLVKFLGKRHSCPVVLGSATPSVESFFEAELTEEGAHGLTLLSLPERAAWAKLPTVDVEDLTVGYRSGQPAMLTLELQNRMAETLERGGQVILFLNRRAYSPFLMCRDCGFRYECPHCAVCLSFHQRERKLRCHHCGYSRRPEHVCPQCEGHRVTPLGVGTERVEEFVRETFPDTRVARLDRDIARRKGALDEILASFRSGDIGVLVGTQMVAKGLDFPNVTVVGVIAADISLNIPDFRSSERTYQLLSQVAGRAGRGQSPGTVVIQTFNPEHPAVKAAALHEFLPYYEELKRERMEANYPPFSRLVNVLLTSENRTALIQASDEARAMLGRLPKGCTVLGPVDCAVERLQNRWRRHLLIKLPLEIPPKAVGVILGDWEPKGVQLVLDVDPHSLM